MQVEGASRGRLRALLDFGGLHGSEHETRDYLSQRVALYFRVLSILYALRYCSALALNGMQGSLWQELLSPARMLHLVAIGITLAAAWLARRPLSSVSQLALADILGTLAVGVAHALSVALRPHDQRTVDLSLILVLTQTLVARAAIVPSSAWRSLLIGAANLTTLSIAMYVQGSASLASSGVPAWIWIYRTLEWGGISVVLTGVLSRVIYGLRRRFEQVAHLGQYVLHEKIGEGGMGIVYRASHAMLRRPTAIKLLPPERAGTLAIQRFEREVQITATLVHPHTVAVYDFGRTPEGTFYYAMEYLDGVDLERLVEADGPQPAGRVVHVMRQVCAALGEAHGKGLIHRDIKPANVVLCERAGSYDFAKVVDFGLVKDLAPRADDGVLSMAQAFVGTPHYLAPEAISSGGVVDTRSDLYSLGGLAYFMLTGKPAFEGKTLVEICGHHLFSKVTPPSQRGELAVPAELEQLVLACLEKDPKQRPSSAEALVAALERLDVPTWTPNDARAWWSLRGSSVRRSSAPASSLEGARTLAVDFEQRAVQ